jgi:hypothetical protein
MDDFHGAIRIYKFRNKEEGSKVNKVEKVGGGFRL